MSKAADTQPELMFEANNCRVCTHGACSCVQERGPACEKVQENDAQHVSCGGPEGALSSLTSQIQLLGQPQNQPSASASPGHTVPLQTIVIPVSAGNDTQQFFSNPVSLAAGGNQLMQPITIDGQPFLAVNLSNLQSLAQPADTVSNSAASRMADDFNLDEMKAFVRQFKFRRLSIGVSQAQVGQALSATEGPAYSQSAIYRFEKLDMPPESAQKMKPVLERWITEAEEKYKSGSQCFADFIEVPEKKYNRRKLITPQALKLLNQYYTRNTHPKEIRGKVPSSRRRQKVSQKDDATGAGSCTSLMTTGSDESTAPVSSQAITDATPEALDSGADNCSDAMIAGNDVDNCSDAMIAGNDVDNCSDAVIAGNDMDNCSDAMITGNDVDNCSDAVIEGYDASTGPASSHVITDTTPQALDDSGADSCSNAVIAGNDISTGPASSQVITDATPELLDDSQMSSGAQLVNAVSAESNDHVDCDDEGAIISDKHGDSKLSNTSYFKTGKTTHGDKKPYNWKISHVRFSMSGYMKINECDVCFLGCSDANELTRHKKTHAAEKCYQCETCGSRFSQLRHLKRHIQLHTGVRPYICNICEVTFIEACDLQRHKVTHAVEKPYKCNVCAVGFSRSSHLTRHSKIHVGEKAFTCNVCQMAFIESCDLQRHKKVHTKEVAGKSNTSAKHLTSTKMNKPNLINEKSYACVQCSRAFSKHSSLIRHAKVHISKKVHECYVCSEAFVDLAQLKKHKSTHGGVKLYHCDACDEGFTRNTDLKRHLNLHTGNKPYKCDVCQMKFVYTYELKQHLYEHTGKRPFVCDVCGRGFLRPGLLKTHKMSHKGEKPHRCDICKKGFVNLFDLKRHLKIHTGSRPYKCGTCELSFSRSSHLKRHESTHTGDKPHKCDACKMQFVERHELKRHQRTHTGEKPYKCDICSAAFTRASILKKHERRNHMEQGSAPSDD